TWCSRRSARPTTTPSGCSGSTSRPRAVRATAGCGAAAPPPPCRCAGASPHRRSLVARSQLAARARPTHLARELEPRATLPYARHLTDRIVALDSGALMMSFRLDGASFETADVRDLNDWHSKLNGAWRNLASDHLAIW